MWFFYISWYLKKVVGLSASQTGMGLLAGQIASGVATPIVGMLSDKYESERYGKRLPYYYFGVLLFVPCILGLFSYPPYVNDDKEGALRKYFYLVMPVLFNIGWANV